VIEATAREESSLVTLAEAVESSFGGDIPMVICAPRQRAATAWQALDANLQVCVPGGAQPSTIIPLLRTVARLGRARTRRAAPGPLTS
jgi:hypothetical protein